MHAKISLAKRSGQTDDIKKYKRHYRKLCKALAMKEEQREIERNKNRNIWAPIKPKTREKPIIIGRDGNRIEDTRELEEAFKDSFKENSTPMTEGQKDIQELVNKAVQRIGYIGGMDINIKLCNLSDFLLDIHQALAMKNIETTL